MNLLTRIEIVTSILLLLSVTSNIVLFFYSRNLLAKLVRFSSEVFELREETTSFANHLKDVYELEMFYGDMDSRFPYGARQILPRLRGLI